MAIRHKLPGIAEENTTRRNVLIGSGYAIGGIGVAAIATSADDDDLDDDLADDGDDADLDTAEAEPEEEEIPADDDDDEADENDVEEEEASIDEDSDDDEAVDTDDGELQTLASIVDRYSEVDSDAIVSVSGSSDTVDSVTFEGGFHAFVFEHAGDSNFQVILSDPDTGDMRELLVNEIGAITGAVGAPLDGEYTLEVVADGDWSVEIVDLFAQFDAYGVPAEASGSGHTVIGPIEIDSATTVTAEHSGDSNFQVFSVDETGTDSFDRELLVNQIGPYDGQTVATDTGKRWITIGADGDWSIHFE